MDAYLKTKPLKLLDHVRTVKPQIIEIIKECGKKSNWNLAQSDPCFEVWLFFRQFAEKANFDGLETCVNWKRYLSTKTKGR